MITSIQNQRVKDVYALQTQAKRRRKAGLIVLEGVRLVRDALHAGNSPETVFYTPDQTETVEALKLHGLEVNTEVMRYMSDTQQPQGIIGVFPMPPFAAPQQPQRLLILDAIRDPGNLGTLLRTAAAAGVHAVVLTPGCVDVFNPKVLRAGMGAHFRVPLVDMVWQDVEAYCAGLTVYLADGQGETRYDTADWSNPWALITGSEAHGASADAQRIAQQHVYIPMAADTESLNAAAATAVLLFEAQRQHL